jgi:hypothetical protein
MKYPNIEAIAESGTIKKSVAAVGHAASIHHWTETAKELARLRSTSIDDLAAIYKDVSKNQGQLSPEQVLMFVEGLLGLMPSKDDQITLVMTQATGAVI